MKRKLDHLGASARSARRRAVDAAAHRFRRGTIKREEFENLINGIDAHFQTPAVETAAERVQIGGIFGKLSVYGFSKNTFEQTTALCRCACGKECIVNISKLASGYTQSCGCLRLRVKEPSSEAAIVASVAATYRRSAKQRGFAFELDSHTVRHLIQGSCFYCGSSPYREWSIVGKNGVRSLLCHGIDRVNNDLGYTPSNVVSCCPRCNYAKRDMSVREFSAWALRLADHLRKHVVSVAG